ncbi:hypothetical protein D3C83_107710 [compost metagenome]
MAPAELRVDGDGRVVIDERGAVSPARVFMQCGNSEPARPKPRDDKAGGGRARDNERKRCVPEPQRNKRQCGNESGKWRDQ